MPHDDTTSMICFSQVALGIRLIRTQTVCWGVLHNVCSQRMKLLIWLICQLQVVRKNASQLEGASTVTWPRAVRGSPFPTPRFTRVPFLRGVPGGFRARPPMKLGARSMQWKRDSQTTTADNGAFLSGNSVPSSGARSLTYVRTEPKPADK